MPLFFPPLLYAAARGFTAAADIAVHYAENSPHTRLHVPPKGAGTIQIVAGAFRAFRFDIEYVSDAYSALNGNSPCKWIVGLRFPAMTVQRRAHRYQIGAGVFSSFCRKNSSERGFFRGERTFLFKVFFCWRCFSAPHCAIMRKNCGRNEVRYGRRVYKFNGRQYRKRTPLLHYPKQNKAPGR